MTRETAFEFDSFLLPLEAAVSTLRTIHEYFCDGHPLSAGVAEQLDNALFTIANCLDDIAKNKRKEVNEAFEQFKAEKKEEGRITNVEKLAVALIKESRKEKK